MWPVDAAVQGGRAMSFDLTVDGIVVFDFFETGKLAAEE